MFKKLRNKLIWINLSITTIVIFITFSAIFLFATQSANRRPPTSSQKIELYSDDIENIVQISIENEKRAAAQDLLITLIISGLIIEIIVALVSYFLAEESIKPVREAYESQKNFIANASHEIKTPLAAISANLEAADIHGNKWIKNVEKETEKLTMLNNELLELARIDLVREPSSEKSDLVKTSTELIESFAPRLTKINFKQEISVNGKISISKADYSQVFGILMDNAIKYSKHKIILKLTDRNLSISNDGATIKNENLNHIFERFYQTDKNSEGVGLGLSIAKSIAERNGWFITVSSTKNLTTFNLQF